MSGKKLNGTVIVTYRCNARCTMCNRYKAPSKPEEEISVETIRKLPQMYFTNITGGEPLIQQDVYPVIYELLSEGYKVSIETNGCVPIEPCNYKRSYKYVMDVKCPSSGVHHKNVLENLSHLQPHDEVKFVIADEKDYKYAKRILRSYPTSAKILFSPMFTDDGKPVIGQQLVDWLIKDKFYYARVQIQMHKCLEVK